MLHIKETKNYYTKLNTVIAKKDAENYVKKYVKIDTVDGEHYPNKCALQGYCRKIYNLHKGNTMKDDFNGIEEYLNLFEREYCEEIIRHFDVMARNSKLHSPNSVKVTQDERIVFDWVPKANNTPHLLRL